MGKTTSGEKQRFDFITVSKTKKFRITVISIIVLGILLLVLGLLLHSTVTKSVLPNDLKILDGTLSNFDGRTCILSNDQPFILSTTTSSRYALSEPIVFTFDENLDQILTVQNLKRQTIRQSYYQGQFWLHVKDNASMTTNGENLTGYLNITCGSKALKIKIIYIPA